MKKPTAEGAQRAEIPEEASPSPSAALNETDGEEAPSQQTLAAPLPLPEPSTAPCELPCTPEMEPLSREEVSPKGKRPPWAEADFELEAAEIQHEGRGSESPPSTTDLPQAKRQEAAPLEESESVKEKELEPVSGVEPMDEQGTVVPAQEEETTGFMSIVAGVLNIG